MRGEIENAKEVMAARILEHGHTCSRDVVDDPYRYAVSHGGKTCAECMTLEDKCFGPR